jgi:hypothetical protein
VTGTITVANDAPIDAVITGVADVISPDIAASVDCGVAFPYALASGATLECSYDADLPDGAERTNTATATQQNYDFDAEGVATASGTTDYSADRRRGVRHRRRQLRRGRGRQDRSARPRLLGIVCAQADDANPDGAVLVDGDGEASFSYALTIGKALDVDIELPCGDTTLTNEALVRSWAASTRSTPPPGRSSSASTARRPAPRPRGRPTAASRSSCPTTRVVAELGHLRRRRRR